MAGGSGSIQYRPGRSNDKTSGCGLRLVDVATGRQLWTNTYDRAAADLLNVQDEIATAIMDAGLRVRLTDSEREQLVRHPTTDGDAYDLYLQSRFYQLWARTRETCWSWFSGTPLASSLQAWRLDS